VDGEDGNQKEKGTYLDDELEIPIIASLCSDKFEDRLNIS